MDLEKLDWLPKGGQILIVLPRGGQIRIVRHGRMSELLMSVGHPWSVKNSHIFLLVHCQAALTLARAEDFLFILHKIFSPACLIRTKDILCSVLLE